MAYTSEKAYELIESAYERGRLAHAFLITGEQGSGKLDLVARVISLVNAEDTSGSGMDLFGEPEPVVQKSLDELEGELVRVIRPQSKSRRIRVDDMRELEKSFYVVSLPGKWKVGVVLNADRMGEGAENAFLKTLEEPPADCLLMLVTDSPELLLPTILSRCVRLPLISSSGERDLSEIEIELLRHLSAFAKIGMENIGAALSLRAAFSQLLVKRKTEIAKANEAALKEEVQRYKNTTDGDAWLKKRDEFYKASTEAEYLNERSRLLEILISWMGDVVRFKSGVDRLDFLSEKSTYEKIAENVELNDLLNRMEALELLRADLETNAQEQLALEVAFLTAFG